MNEQEKSKQVMEYKAQNGDMIRITPKLVRDFLVQGKRELVTVQELFYFMHVCKARKLNPMVKDCYLIKYGNEAAAIVTSVDYFRKNARKAEDCRGWQCGVIVQQNTSPTSIEYREGSLVLDGEVLVGGWATAQPTGWHLPKRHTVNLAAYIKRTKDGTITRFWAEDRQPDMIMKVAETQLLRQIWGEESTGMYTPEEMPSMEDIDMSPMAQTVQSDTVSRLKPETVEKATVIPEPEFEVPPEPESFKQEDAAIEAEFTAGKPDDKPRNAGQFVKKPVAEPEPEPEKLEPVGPGTPPEWDREEWFRKKSSGFTTHVWKHIKTLPPELEGEVRAKWFKLYGADKIPFPSDQPGNKVSTTAPAAEPDQTTFHDPSDFDDMPAPLQELYLELANINSCEYTEINPRVVNAALKTRHFKQWEIVRNENNFATVPISVEAADVWNNGIGLMLTGGNF